MSGWAGAVAFSGGTLIPSLDRLRHPEPVEGQRPTDSDADSAGGFAPLAEQPRLAQSPPLAQLLKGSTLDIPVNEPSIRS
jgi:hypothetical protein